VAAATGLFFALQNQFRWELRSREFAGTSLLYAGLMVGLGVLLGGVLGLGLGGILTGQLLAALVGGAVSFLLLRQSLAFAIDRARLRALLAFSWPLVFSGVATFLSLYANRLILNSLATLEDVGVYAVGHRVATLAALVIVGVQSALTPLIYTHHREPGTPSQLATLFSGFVAVALMACLGTALFAPELLRIFAPAGYASATGLVAVLAPAALMSQMYIFAPGIALAKKTVWQLGVFAVSAAVSVALSLLLVPLLGAAGAAWSALASALVFLSLWMVASQRLYPVPFQWRRIALAVAAFLACVAVHQWWLPAFPGFWPGLLARALLLGALAVLLLATGLVRLGQLRAMVSRRLAT
jgi:O-antigen/teichoic acid export membrane protein